jgi:ABC-type transport system involved in multi-copper enzyme maturation permease subunit
MFTAARLAYRLQRWELIVLVGGSLLLALAMVLVAWQLSATQEAVASCVTDAGSASLPSDCRSLIDWGNLMTAAGGIVPNVALMLPFVVGILLGAPLVAREIEKRTAPIAWSMSRSRPRWLAGRLVAVALATVISLLAVGAASEAVLQAPRPDAQLGFASFGFHGPIIAARGLAVLLIGVPVGLVLGRVLPAILVTGLLAIALVGGLTFARTEMMRAEATWVAVPEDGGDFAMIYDQAWTDDVTGELVTYDEAFERFPQEFGPEGSWMPPGLTSVYLTTPARLYPVFVARETAALAGIGLVAGALSLVLMRFRRPE